MTPSLSHEAKLVSGIILLTIPTIIYGGATLLSMLTSGVAGPPTPNLQFDATQSALWRAGHAHAGVLVIYALICQVLLDSAQLSSGMRWIARGLAPLSAITLSGGFFGLAFSPSFRWLLYTGIVCLTLSAIISGIGLLRNNRKESTQ